jgi:sugar lactone lactonase YvrE
MMSSSVRRVTCVAAVEAILGEGPLWDPRSKRLLFVDIKAKRIHVYDPDSRAVESFDAPTMVSAIGLRRAGDYVCAHAGGFAELRLEERRARLTAIADPESDRPGNRFNDGKVDPMGGFWAGTMDDAEKSREAGSWWRLGPDRRVARLDGGFHVTNGPAFDTARGRVYFTDSARRIVYAADIADGAFRGKRVFTRFEAAAGYPDGMETDRLGNLWIAFWDGGVVRRFSPDGDLTEEILVPALRPTSIAFAGDRAYVTSARVGLAPPQLAAGPLSGALFEFALSGDLAGPARYYEG